MEEELRALLLASSAVTAVSAGRINWGLHPQGKAVPYIVLWVISDSEGHTLDGPDKLSQGRVQVDCYGGTYASAKHLSRAVRTALDGYAGGGFQGVFLDGSQDSRDGGTNETERLFRTRLDFITVHNS